MPTPNLGYGQRGEASIDAVNQWMRSTPWYQQLITSFGQNPNNVHLSDDQKQAVVRAAQANGVVVDEGHNGQEVDDSGNFQAKSHKLRNTLIVAGVAAAAIATMGAAGVFAGGAGAAGAGGAAGGGVAAAGGGAAAAGTGATVAGVEGLGWGVGDAAVAGLGTGAMGATGVAGAVGAAGVTGAASAAGGGAMDASSPWLADGTFAGDSTFGSVANSAAGSSVWSKLALKYGPEAVSGAIKGGLSYNEAQQKLKQEAALEETRLDPFRGYMAQARDVGKLDMQAEGNFASSPVQLDKKYGAGLDLQPEQFYTPSALMRTVARGNRDAIAAGNTVPTMTDPANYGKMPVGAYAPTSSSAPAPAGASSAGAPATAILAALRSKGLLKDDQTDNQTSPWLA